MSEEHLCHSTNTSTGAYKGQPQDEWGEGGTQKPTLRPKYSFSKGEGREPRPVMWEREDFLKDHTVWKHAPLIFLENYTNTHGRKVRCTTNTCSGCRGRGHSLGKVHLPSEASWLREAGFLKLLSSWKSVRLQEAHLLSTPSPWKPEGGTSVLKAELQR